MKIKIEFCSDGLEFFENKWPHNYKRFLFLLKKFKGEVLEGYSFGKYWVFKPVDVEDMKIIYEILKNLSKHVVLSITINDDLYFLRKEDFE